MAVPYDRIGNWSEVKLDIVREYATAYSTVLAARSEIRRHIYIDAFAGWGIHLSKNSGGFVPGSPVNALAVQPPFSEYHFIDLDNKRVENLQTLSRERENVHLHQGNCNDVLLNEVFPRCRYEDFSRALCLLDPYSLNVDWDVLLAAGQSKSIEVFYNFMIMDANMNVLWRNPDLVTDAHKDRMNRVWGDESWRDAAYAKQKGLFGDIEEKRSNEELAEAFRKRLNDVAGFEYVPDPVPMRNKSGATIYYLYFASHKKVAHKIVTDIFSKYRSRV